MLDKTDGPLLLKELWRETFTNLVFILLYIGKYGINE